MGFIDQLVALFESNANPEFASGMKAYMRNKFEFYGVKSQLRRELVKKTVVLHKDYVAENTRTIALELYQLPYRELHHCGMEIFEKELRKTYKKEDIKFIEQLISINSWWDTVDYIAKNILGKYLLMYPEEINAIISKFTRSDDLWLNRSTIIFQLGYKTKTNEDILFEQCMTFRHSKEFFIQKAIGWSLREYGKTNPENVLKFVNSTQLKPLSRKEAIRNILK